MRAYGASWPRESGTKGRVKVRRPPDSQGSTPHVAATQKALRQKGCRRSRLGSHAMRHWLRHCTSQRALRC